MGSFHRGGTFSSLSDVQCSRGTGTGQGGPPTRRSSGFNDGRITDQSLERRLREALDTAHELEQLAFERDIPIEEPFSGEPLASQGITILSPTRDYYQSLLPQFRSTPDPTAPSFLTKAAAAFMEAVSVVAEHWHYETLQDPEPGAASAENESSVVFFFESDGKRFLFTGDAGVGALTLATTRAYRSGVNCVNLTDSFFRMVQHHGSRRDCGPTILNNMVCAITGTLPQEPDRFAIVSASKEGAPKHPAKKVTNAYQRRGVQVYATQGKPVCCYSPDAPQRSGYSRAVPLDFFYSVEE